MDAITTAWDDDPLMFPAFIGCVRWALGKDEMLDAFRAETGNNWTPGKTGIDVAIDKATGADREFMQAFSDWVCTNIFGTPDDIAKEPE